MGKKEYLACLISLVMLGLTACSDNANKTGSEVSSGTSSAEEKDYGYGFDKFGFSRFDVETAESLTYEIKQRSYILQTTIRPLQLLTTTREYTMKFTLKTL